MSKVRMEMYLEINGVFLVWSVKSVGLQNVCVIKICHKYKNSCKNFDWLKTNVDSCQMFQFLNWEVTFSGKKSNGGPNSLQIKFMS